MEEVKRLREQARKAEQFAKDNPTVATSKQFSDVAAAFAQQADERERSLMANDAISADSIQDTQPTSNNDTPSA